MAVVLVAVTAVAVLVYATGGQSSWWSGLFFVPLAAAGFLSLARATITAFVASVLYLTAVVTYTGAPFSPTRSSITVLLFFLVSLIVGLLTKSLWQRQDSLDREAEEARHAMDIQHMINAAYDIDVTLDMVLLKQQEIVRCDMCAILLSDDSHLRVRASHGLSEEGRLVWISVHEDDQGWTPLDGRPLVIADTLSAPTRLSSLAPDARSILAVPMHSVERLVGLLFFASRSTDGFSTEDMNAAENFATTTVFAVQRAILEEELRRLAFTDAQTSLYNHRHFQTQLDEEVRRSMRYGRDMALILLDIDDFKRLNDVHGHPAGDRLLREIATILRASLRTVDIPARYGGEEFAVICPETRADQAQILAERLCRQVANKQFDLQENLPVRVTISVGVAALPDHAGNKSDLIECADQALYSAKRSGKNRVVVFDPESVSL